MLLQALKNQDDMVFFKFPSKISSFLPQGGGAPWVANHWGWGLGSRGSIGGRRGSARSFSAGNRLFPAAESYPPPGRVSLRRTRGGWSSGYLPPPPLSSLSRGEGGIPERRQHGQVHTGAAEEGVHLTGGELPEGVEEPLDDLLPDLPHPGTRGQKGGGKGGGGNFLRAPPLPLQLFWVPSEHAVGV